MSHLHMPHLPEEVHTYHHSMSMPISLSLNCSVPPLYCAKNNNTHTIPTAP